MVLTPRQREVYDFVARFIEERGYAPTIAEIKERLGLRSPATVHQLLSALEDEALIRRVPHASRAIELVNESGADESNEIPLLGTVAAGRPIEAILSDETIAVPPDMVGRGHTFALRVRGDSMIDEQIREGDFIIVASGKTATNGQTVVALVNGSEATVKRFYKERDRVRLEPANSNYEPIIVKPPDRLDIQGVVIGVIRKYRN
jgi:repressor LexA